MKMIYSMRKFFLSAHIIKNIDFKKSMLLASIAAIALLHNGCIGMLARHQATAEGGKYSELKSSMQPPSQGMGRLVVYLVSGGPDIFLTSGVWDACTVDNVVYYIMGRSYWFVDLPSGQHRVTATGVLSSWGTMSVKGYGEKILDIDLVAGDTKFIRIIMSGSTVASRLNTYTPTLVSGEVAEPELAELDFFVNFRTKDTIK